MHPNPFKKNLLTPDDTMNAAEKITIVVASDDHYAVLVAPLIKSIEVNHHTQEKIDFYIIDDGISLKNRQKLQATTNPDMTTLHWIKSSEVIPAGVKIPVDNTAFPFTTYFRLFAPYVIPPEVSKVIYLDVDMIVVEDIAKLWHTDIQDHLFAAVQDWQETVSKHSWGGIPNYQELGIPPQTKYFNAGLLLINTRKWRENGVVHQVIKCLEDNKKHVNYADQYGLNVALYDQWQVLDKNWNCFATFEYPNPYIIHFLDIKPIFNTYNSRPEYKDEFFKYLELTPWRGYKPVSGKRRLIRKIYNKLRKKVSHLAF
jgi:lipopolysaccharide biosynthesis glycosyltransferase